MTRHEDTLRDVLRERIERRPVLSIVLARAAPGSLALPTAAAPTQRRRHLAERRASRTWR